MAPDRMSLSFITSPTDSNQKRGSVSAVSDGSDSDAATQRRARYQYDGEQSAYILYLYYWFKKVDHDADWSTVERLFEQMFPPNTPRRIQGRGLTEHYEPRRINGLNSKFYRLRDENLPKNEDLETRKNRVAEIVRPYNFPPISELQRRAREQNP